MAIKSKKLSLKVFTEQRPPLGSYEPALSPKTAPDSFSHPEDALDLESYIGQVAPAFVLPNVIELDGIKEATSGQGVIVDNVVMKNGVVLIGDGSVTAPSLTFDSQNSLGLYKFGSNVLGVASNGVSSLRISSGGIATGAAAIDTIYANSINSRIGPGAFSVSVDFETLQTTGTNDALTLALGQYGMVKKIVMTVDGGDGILTPTGLIGGTTITFSAVGQTASLISLGAGGWAVLSLNGAVLA
jgi:hypothetical protein